MATQTQSLDQMYDEYHELGQRIMKRRAEDLRDSLTRSGGNPALFRCTDVEASNMWIDYDGDSIQELDIAFITSDDIFGLTNFYQINFAISREFKSGHVERSTRIYVDTRSDDKTFTIDESRVSWSNSQRDNDKLIRMALGGIWKKLNGDRNMLRAISRCLDALAENAREFHFAM